MSYGTFKLRMGISGDSIRNTQIHNTRHFVEKLIVDDPSFRENVEILGKGHVSARFNNYKIVHGTTPQMDIQASLSEDTMFNMGDIFFLNDSYWLCVEAITEHDVFRKGKVEECNYLLRWQNPITLEIIERWGSIRNPYSSGVAESRVISIERSKYRIKLPYDDETALFRVGKRFLIDVQGGNEVMPYSIIEYDPVTMRYMSRDEGFLIINLQSSQIEDDDNADLMIANYISPPSLPQQIGSCRIVFSGNPLIRVGGSIKTFAVVFYDYDGNEISTITPTWNLILPPELNSTQIVSNISGQSIDIQALAGSGNRFVLQMNAEDYNHGFFEAAVEIEVGDLF